MPILEPPEPGSPPITRSQAAAAARSFGADADRYDRARPRYPTALVARVVEGNPGRQVLDVGCGTGIAARQFQAAGCELLGVDPDPRMADVARAGGVAVEVATFEGWEAGGRMFDAVIAAQSWHWVDPEAGARKAATVLRPRGRLAIFGHVFEPPVEVAEPFADVFRRVAPGSPFSQQPAARSLAGYEKLYARVGDTVRETGRFGEPEQWRFDWERSYSRDEWLDLLPTTGGLTSLRPDQLAEILDEVGHAIDSLGGHFTMTYTTLATTAVRATG